MPGIDKFLQQIMKMDPNSDNPTKRTMYQILRETIEEWEKNRPVFVKK